MRKLAFLTIATVLIFLSVAPLHADDTVLFTAIVSPDALIALDLSSSMERNPGGNSNYQVNPVASGAPCTDTFTFPTSDPSHPNKCDSLGYVYSDSACGGPFYKVKQGIYTTDCSKLAIAQRTIFRLLDDNHDDKLQKADEDSLNVRIGYMRFFDCQGEDSSISYSEPWSRETNCNTLKRGLGFDYSGLYDIIKTEPKDGRTTLAMQLREGLKYLNDHKNGVSPAASEPDPARACRKKFIVMITDGGDNCACGGKNPAADVSGPAGVPDGKLNEYDTGSFSYMRRRATLAVVKDVVDAGYQVFTVGFGADMPTSERRTLEWVAYKGGTFDPSQTPTGDTSAVNFHPTPCDKFNACVDWLGNPDQLDCINAPNDPGRKNLTGYAFLAQDASALSKSLQTIFKYIREKALTFTAPTVPSVRLSDTVNAYISSLAPNTTPFWRGNLKAYELEDNGTLPVGADGFPTQDPIWEAQSILAITHPDDRKIYTVKNGNRVAFIAATFTNADLGVSSDTERDELVKHVRGFDPWDIDGDGSTTDTRAFKLGDIFHSQAVIVGVPSNFFVDSGYSGTGGFYDTKKNRTKVILAGANDGMLHAFDAATGAEKWAFIPPSLLTSLKTMKSRWDTYKASGSAGEHLYYVDGSPRVSDVWFYSSATDKTKTVDEWKTVLISGLRKGGKTYFALDITDTENPVYLWEFPKSTDTTTLNKMGQSWSDPFIGRIKIDVGGTVVERWVAFIGGGYRLNEDDSEGRYLFVVDIKTGDIIKEFSGFSAPIAAPPLAADTTSDGYVDRIYVGDQEGRMYVMYIMDLNPTNWTQAMLTDPPGDESGKYPVFYPPAVAFDDKGTPWVFYGTGDRENPTSNSKNKFYAVKDNKVGPYPRTKEYLVDVTTNPGTFTPVPADKYGWLMKMVDKEKVFAKPIVFNRLVYYTTYSPNEVDTDVCTTGGTARLYIAEYLSGGGALSVDDMSDLAGSTTERSIVVGSGVPSTPVISLDTNSQATLIIGTTENQIYSQEVFSPDTNKHVLYWREVFD